MNGHRIFFGKGLFARHTSKHHLIQLLVPWAFCYCLKQYQRAKACHRLIFGKFIGHYQWSLTQVVLSAALSTIHLLPKCGMPHHPRTSRTKSGHNIGGIVLCRNQDDETHLYRHGTPGSCGEGDWAAFLLRKEFAPQFFSNTNTPFLCPAHKDRRCSL